MKKIFVLFLALAFAAGGFAQSIARITIDRSGSLEHISIGLDENTVIYLGKDGSMLKWGFDRYAARGMENYDNSLDPYMGRVEYYGPNDDAAFRGKIKSIGRFQLTYFASYDNESFRGKLKSIGGLTFDYYQAFEDKAFQGNIKSIGQNSFTWYTAFDNEAFRGKLKSVGPTAITYYGSFEDKLIRGKVKTLGNSSFTWYTSFDLKEYGGAMKTGTQLQTLSAVKYFVKG